MDNVLFPMYEEFLKNIPVDDVKINKKIMSCFLECFLRISEVMPRGLDVGFFMIPLHRVFAFYITRLLMLNYC